MKTQVAIIGAGPSGLLLSQLLNRQGIETVVLERSSRAHVLGRIRAGVLEWGAVELLREAGVSGRMDVEGFRHDGIELADNDRSFRIDFKALLGKQMMVYGQTEITGDLYAAQDLAGATIQHGVEDVVISDLDQEISVIEYTYGGQRRRLEASYIAGCDGFHGVSRQTIPVEKRKEYERVYPFGWLGVLSRTKPAFDEVTYANTERGFALASMRNANLSRYYIQVPLSDRAEDWSDDAFWEELKRRLPGARAETMITGPSIEKSIAPLRSFVCEPLRWGNLFLIGDAAHIVPPTGAKGLNLAASDVWYLYHALVDALRNGSDTGIDEYSARALSRIWKAMRFSWEMTMMLHRFDGEDSFAAAMRRATLDLLASSETAQRNLAENYTGLPY